MGYSTVPNLEPLAIPSLHSYRKQTVGGRCKNYQEWFAHIKSLAQAHGWTEKEYGRLTWSCCGAQGLWSESHLAPCQPHAA